MYNFSKNVNNDKIRRKRFREKLKGSRTEANLLAAYAKEAQTANKYLYYAAKAKKDGYVQIGTIFEETAGNESVHAGIWFKILHGAF